MKTSLSCGICGVLATVAALLFTSPPPLSGQDAAALAAAAAAQEEQVLAGLAGTVQSQQEALQANQVKIDQKLAAVAEEVRQARLFASRGGNRR